MLWCVLHGGTVWWYYRLVCYGVYCMEVVFSGNIDLYVNSCIVWRYCLVVLWACMLWRVLYGSTVWW